MTKKNTCFYIFIYRKISQYSPSEGAKVYEKAVNRKNNNKFNPKATINKLKEGDCNKELDEDGRRDLINQYLEVSFDTILPFFQRQLIISFLY